MFLLPLPDDQLRIEISCCRLDPVDVPHEDGVLELDVRLVLVLQLLRVDGSNPGPKLEAVLLDNPIILLRLKFTHSFCKMN
jgi:hypothetical protein